MNYFNAYTLSQLANDFANLLISTFRNKMDLHNLYCYMFLTGSVLPKSVHCHLQRICWSVPGSHNLVLQRHPNSQHQLAKRMFPFWNVKAYLMIIRFMNNSIATDQKRERLTHTCTKAKQLWVRWKVRQRSSMDLELFFSGPYSVLKSNTLVCIWFQEYTLITKVWMHCLCLHGSWASCKVKQSCYFKSPLCEDLEMILPFGTARELTLHTLCAIFHLLC